MGEPKDQLRLDEVSKSNQMISVREMRVREYVGALTGALVLAAYILGYFEGRAGLLALLISTAVGVWRTGYESQ